MKVYLLQTKKEKLASKRLSSIVSPLDGNFHFLSVFCVSVNKVIHTQSSLFIHMYAVYQRNCVARYQRKKPPTISACVYRVDISHFIYTFIVLLYITSYCLFCILNDILWLPNNLFSLIIIPDSNSTWCFVEAYNTICFLLQSYSDKMFLTLMYVPSLSNIAIGTLYEDADLCFWICIQDWLWKH